MQQRVQFLEIYFMTMVVQGKIFTNNYMIFPLNNRLFVSTVEGIGEGLK